MSRAYTFWIRIELLYSGLLSIFFSIYYNSQLEFSIVTCFILAHDVITQTLHTYFLPQLYLNWVARVMECHWKSCCDVKKCKKCMKFLVAVDIVSWLIPVLVVVQKKWNFPNNLAQRLYGGLPPWLKYKLENASVSTRYLLVVCGVAHFFFCCICDKYHPLILQACCLSLRVLYYSDNVWRFTVAKNRHIFNLSFWEINCAALVLRCERRRRK